MTNEKAIFMRLTNRGNELLEQSYLDGVPFLTKDWQLKLGSGSSDDYMNLSDLVETLYDKNSGDYTGFMVYKNHIKYGRCAQFEIPMSLQNKIITEAGFFNPEGELVMYGMLLIDYTKMASEGVKQSTTVYVSLHAVPPDAIDLTINISNSFIIKEEMQNAIKISYDNHNIDPDAHSYLARLNGNKNEIFNVKTASAGTHAINLNQLNASFTSKKTVVPLGTVSGTITLDYDKIYSATLSGDTTIKLNQPQRENELYECYFNFTNPNGAYSLTLPSNSAYNNGIVPNYNVANEQRIIFETISRGERVTAYYSRRG